MHALNVTICINESIEGWATVTVISPISGQQGTVTVINKCFSSSVRLS